MSAKQHFLVHVVLTLALLCHPFECSIGPNSKLGRPGAIHRRQRAIHKAPIQELPSFDQQKAEKYATSMKYDDLQTPYVDSVVKEYQGESDPNNVHWIDNKKFKRYVSGRFPNKQGIKFPDGVYDFVVLSASPNQIELLFTGTSTVATALATGHTSLLTAQQHKDYLEGKLKIKYAGDLMLKQGRIDWWSSRSGHFMPDQNKYMVFAKHWGLPTDKYLDVEKRGNTFMAHTAPMSGMEGESRETQTQNEEAVIVHSDAGVNTSGFELSVITAVFLVLSCLCALMCVAVGFGLGFGCLLSMYDRKNHRVRDKRLRRIDHEIDENESRSVSPPVYVPVVPVAPKYSPAPSQVSSYVPVVAPKIYAPNYAPIYAPQNAAAQQLAVEDPADQNDDVAEAAEQEQSHAESV